MAVTERLPSWVSAIVNSADDTPEGLGQALFAVSGHAASMIVKKLLARGALLEWRNLTGITPLIHAAGSLQIEDVAVLLAAGADANACDYGGRTPLLVVVTHDCDSKSNLRARERIVTLLLKAGARADQAGPGLYGPPVRTPAEHARALGYPSLWKLLTGSKRKMPDLLNRRISWIEIKETKTFSLSWWPNDTAGPIHIGGSEGVGGICDPGWSAEVSFEKALGWAHEIEKEGAGWFVPILRKLAAGQPVDVDEILRRGRCRVHRFKDEK